MEVESPIETEPENHMEVSYRCNLVRDTFTSLQYLAELIFGINLLNVLNLLQFVQSILCNIS